MFHLDSSASIPDQEVVLASLLGDPPIDSDQTQRDEADSTRGQCPSYGPGRRNKHCKTGKAPFEYGRDHAHLNHF